MSTTFMNLQLPVVSVTLGPEWANQINAALERIDQHNHSSGNGQRITPLGMNINAELDFNNNRASDLQLVQFRAQSATQTGSTNANSIYSVNGDLYFTNSNGVAVQITSGGSIIASPANIQSFTRQAVSSDIVIAPSDLFVFLTVDTTSPRSITLPLASGVADGRIYIIKDISGQSLDNPITLNAAGSDLIDGAASVTLNSNFSSWMVIGDGASNWYIS